LPQATRNIRYLKWRLPVQLSFLPDINTKTILDGSLECLSWFVIPMADVEILVHTSAPSRGQDDARYRALAHAYLQFAPATRQRIGVVEGVLNNDVDGQAESQIREELLSSAPEEPQSWESYQPDEEDEGHEDEDDYQESELVPTQHESHDRLYQLKSLESPQISFKSAADNANSPASGRRHVTWIPPRSKRDYETQDSSDSRRGPPSTIADSQPEHKKGLEAFSSPTHMLELLLQQIDSSDQDSGETHIHRELHETASGRDSSQAFCRLNTRDLETQEPQTGSAGAFPSSHPLPRRDVNITIASPILGDQTFSAGHNMNKPTVSTASSSSIPPPPLSNIENRQTVLTSKLPAVTLHKPTHSSVLKENIPIPETRSNRRSARIAGNSQSSEIAASTTSSDTRQRKALTDQVVSSSEIQVPETHRAARKAPYSSSSSNLQMSSLPGRVVPETPYHLPPANQAPLTGTKRNCLGVSSQEGHISVSAPPTIKPISSSLDSPSSKRRRIQKSSSDLVSSSIPEFLPPLLPPLARKGLLRTISDQSAGLNAANSTVAVGMSSPIRDLSKVSYLAQLTISPPPPPTSSMNIDPSTFITHALSEIAKKVPMSKFYKPLSQTRNLRLTERGYWLINTHPWPQELRHRVWDYLGTFIAASRAGWGVRCERNDELTSFRVYCWGILVPYIYLLLFLASETKVRRVEATWIGGDGTPLVTMPVMK
jgi:hypothetical protein